MKLKNLFFVSAALVYCGGCAMFKNVEYHTSDGIAIEKLPYKYSFSEEEKTILLSHKDNVFDIKLNRRIAKLNGIKVWLLSPTRMDEQDIPRIHQTNVDNIIKPLLELQQPSPSPVKRIILDPGHGDHDKGAVGKISLEKDLNLKLALKLRQCLEDKGFEVIMTRSDDTFVSLDRRSEFAKEQKADLFISIHHNASIGAPNASGVETYSLSSAGMPSSNGTKGKIPGTLPGNAFDAANVKLNYLIHSNLIKSVGGNDRGVKFARFKVLVNAPCPAVLVEVGFISNVKEEVLLNTEARQNKTADAIAKGIAEYAKAPAAVKTSE